MDLKLKSTKWVGSIYHTFEAICHEVDDFVSQETMKFVENQAQTVGSVKRFYSNVVQDLIPTSLTQHGKHGARMLSHEQKEKDAMHIEPTIGIEKKQVHTDVNDGHANSSSGSEIEILEHESDIVLRENDQKVLLTDKKCDTSFQENDLAESPRGKIAYICEENELTEDWMNTNVITVEANDTKMEPSGTKEREESMKTSAHNVEENDLKKMSSRTNEKEEWRNEEYNANNVEDYNLKKVPSRPKEKEEWMNTNANNVEENYPKEEPSQPKEMDLFYSGSENLPEASLRSDIPMIECTSVISNLLPPLEMNFPIVSVDNKTVESELLSSRSPLSSEMVDKPHNEENLSSCLVNEIESDSNPLDAISSSQPLPVVSCDDADMKRALSSNAFDEDVSADEIAAQVASFEDNHGDEDNSMVDITDPSMVTIELSDDKAKLDESCILVENKLLYAVFCRSRKHNSYKKIFQDAFASRKRLRKEYEQLGILFGDIDIESSQRRGDNLLPEITSPTLGSEKFSSGDLSEWELL